MKVTSEHYQFMERAIDLAAKAVESGAGRPFGAVLVEDGVVLSEGFNSIHASGDPTAHAEMLALRRVFAAEPGRSLKGAVLYASGEPCPMCLAALYLAGVPRCFYSATRDEATRIGAITAKIYAEMSLDPADRSLPAMRIPSERASAMFSGG